MSRNPIQDNFVILCNQLNLDKILPYLKQERMVTTDEYEILTNPNFTVKQKREKLLIWLPRKGRNYFTNFGKCLVWSGQTELARHIGVDVALVPEAPFELPEDEPTPEQNQQQIMRLLHSLISQPGPTIPPPPSAPVYSMGGAAQRTGSAPLQAPVLTSPPPPIAGGCGNAPLAHAYGHPPSNARVPGVPPQPALAPLHPLASQSVPMDYTSSVNPAYHQQPPGFVLRASVPNEEPARKKVFILYCKDQQLPPTFADEVLDLADTLNHLGGFECTVDHYVDVPPPNWNIWTQQRIYESQYVLLILSPTLAHKIKNPIGEDVLDMEKGKYYVNSIVNCIHPPKFIPVFLNNHIPPAANHIQWIPSQLRMSTAYCLNIAEFHATLLVPEGTPKHVFHEMLRVALEQERFKVVASLMHHLRGEGGTPPPKPPQVPVAIPAVTVDPKVPVVQQPPPAPDESHIPFPVQEQNRMDSDEESMPSFYSHEQDIAHPQSEVHKMAGVAEEQTPDIKGEEERLFIYNRECAANNLVSS